MSQELITQSQAQRKTRFKELEAEIQNNLYGMNACIDALCEISTDELYKEAGFTTFAGYLQMKWPTLYQKSLGRIYQILAHENIVKQIAAASETTEDSTNCRILPQNEAQTRPLNVVPEESRPEVWQAAVEDAGGKTPSGRQVDETVNRLFSENPEGKSEEDSTNCRIEPESNGHTTPAPAAAKPLRNTGRKNESKKNKRVLLDYELDLYKGPKRSAMRYQVQLKKEQIEEVKTSLSKVLRYLFDNKIIGFHLDKFYYITKKGKGLTEETEVTEEAETQGKEE